jgi:transposase InsO family protein
VPWKECDKMSERIKFVGRLLNGEKMTDLCLEFGISRVTGYKMWNRYEAEGVKAIQDRSCRPWRLGNQTPPSVERAILEVKRKYPTWGAPKILALMQRKHPSTKLPVKSTVHAILDRHGFVKRRRRNGCYKAEGSVLKSAQGPNDLWCADFKGQFRMGNQQYCYPLTVTDQYSRYLIGCEALESTKEVSAIENFKRLFRDYGLPRTIRTDNGLPFAARSIFGLSKLSVLWLRLGIEIERIRPGHPEQNGQHERMHRTLKETVTKPAGKNLLQQQEIMDSFLKVFNEERPHEALQMKCPADVYHSSDRVYPEILDEFNYTGSDLIRRISGCGTISISRGGSSRKIFISEVFANQEVGIKKIEEGVWSVRFMDFNLGYFSDDSHLFSPGPNPFIKIVNQ